MTSKRFCIISALAFVLSLIQAPAYGKFVLVIDAGHGGNDAGAIGTYSYEKNINLNVALAFGALVEKNCSDVKVIYTRKTDVFIPLQERAAIANRNKADLFISVHTNALPGGKIAVGSETYALGMARSAENLDVAKRENSVILIEQNYKEKYAGFDPSSSESYIIFEFMQDQHIKQSISLARSIQKRYVSVASRPDKGVHQAGFLVLRETSMPSVLTELGFITTPEEEAFLNSSSGVQKLSRAIFEGFLDYLQTVDGRIRQNIEYTPETETAPKAGQDKEQSSDTDKAGEDSDNNSAVPDTTAPKAEKAEKKATATKSADTAAATPRRAKESSVDNKKTEQKKQTETTKETSSKSNSRQKANIEYRIQFLTSTTQLKKDDPRIASYKGVSFYQDKANGLYKYTCLPRHTYKEALAAQKEVREKIKDAFIVSFKGGHRIELSEARQIENGTNQDKKQER